MKKFLALIIIIAISLSLIGCGNNEKTSEVSGETEDGGTEKSVVDEIKEKGYITVATSPDCPPSEFIIIEDGKEKVVGSDIAIAEEIAKDLGVELKLKTMAFEGLLLELDSGNVDLVVASLAPTEERVKAFDFSDVYSVGDQVILIREESMELFTTISDFDGKKVGVQATSLQEKLANEQMPDANIIPLSNVANIIMDLISGNIDACVVPEDIAHIYISQHPTLAISMVEVEYEGLGSAIAIKKGNTELVEAVNETIARLKEAGLIDQFEEEAYELLSKQ